MVLSLLCFSSANARATATKKVGFMIRPSITGERIIAMKDPMANRQMESHFRKSIFPGQIHHFASLHFRPSFQRRKSKFLQTPSNPQQNEVEALGDGGASPVESLALAFWISTMSALLLVNYFGGGPWPENFIFDTPLSTWSLLHAVSAMLFSGTIIVSTLVEWSVVASRQANVLRFWFWTVPQLDALVVLPALTGTVLSGVAQACHLYGSFATAPRHVTGAVHGLLAFGIWWAATDVTTQRSSKTAVQKLINNQNGSTELPPVLLLRRASNVASCLVVLALYSIMVLKPTF
jgi:hypothetical protein